MGSLQTRVQTRYYAPILITQGVCLYSVCGSNWCMLGLEAWQTKPHPSVFAQQDEAMQLEHTHTHTHKEVGHSVFNLSTVAALECLQS